MNRTIKRIAGCLITLALIVCMVRKLDYIVRPTDTDAAYKQITAFHQMPEDSIDVIVYGSSHALNGVDAMELYREYGLGAYNYGMHWQKINTVKLFIQDSLLSQSPKIALIETFNAQHVLHDTDITAEIFYTRYLKDRKDCFQYLRQCFGSDPERYLSYYMPLCAFHDNWTTLTEKSFSPIAQKNNYVANMGYSPSNNVGAADLSDPSTVEQKQFNALALNELNEIVSICHGRGIEVIFFTVPCEGGSPYSDALKAFSAENGCAYLDLCERLDEVGIDAGTDFRNSGHLNNSGAKKVSDYLGKYIVEHYDLTDMRGVEGNIWAQTLNGSNQAGAQTDSQDDADV